MPLPKQDTNGLTLRWWLIIDRKKRIRIKSESQSSKSDHVQRRHIHTHGGPHITTSKLLWNSILLSTDGAYT
jgi:hypothetical protein